MHTYFFIPEKYRLAHTRGADPSCGTHEPEGRQSGKNRPPKSGFAHRRGLGAGLRFAAEERDDERVREIY